jgi:sugar phosphate isomerase/epimerase
MFHSRFGCSSISFRHQSLRDALTTIAGLGFTEIDLGALPGVCDHVPYYLDSTAVADVADEVADSGLTVRSVNGDVGDLNRPIYRANRPRRERHLHALLALAAASGARALVLPCGALSPEPLISLDADLNRVAAELAAAADTAAAYGLELWTESLHYHRVCWNVQRAQALADRLDGTAVRLVMDFSHVVASGGDPVEFVDRFGDRIAHVHIRDAVPGNINVSVGRGQVDFARGLKALAGAGYTGQFALELETRDITDDQRPQATVEAARLISDLI